MRGSVSRRIDRREVGGVLTQILAEVGAGDVVSGTRRRASRLEISDTLIVAKLALEGSLTAAQLFS